MARRRGVGRNRAAKAAVCAARSDLLAENGSGAQLLAARFRSIETQTRSCGSSRIGSDGERARASCSILLGEEAGSTRQ